MKKFVTFVFLSVFAISMITFSCNKSIKDEANSETMVGRYSITINIDKEVAKDSVVFVINNVDRKFFETEDGKFNREMPINVPAINKVQVKVFDKESGEFGFISEEFYDFKVDTIIVAATRGDGPGIGINPCIGNGGGGDTIILGR